ncbi:hypothetical protein [Congregicoccus parvus]|uniref:hypothetical protein n=1 Tax=Congregicoccus parvus TaxID=3081749 RepID=UPI003FA55BFA
MSASTPASTSVSPGVPLVGGGLLPLAFVVAALVSLIASVGWAVVAPDVLAYHHLHPHVAAHVHLWLPGCLLAVCIGVIYQMMPVVLGVALRAPVSLPWIHLVLHFSGTGAMVLGFVGARFEHVALGGSALAAGALLLAITAWRTFLRSDRRDTIAWSFPVSTTWLFATAAIGVFAAVNRRWPMLPVSPVALLQAHAHLGLAGFFLSLLQGATFQLVPMFTMGTLRRPRCVAAGFACAQTGLVFLVGGLTTAHTWLAWFGIATLVAGVALSATAFLATLAGRRRRRLDPGVRAFVVGAALLGLAAVVGSIAFAGSVPVSDVTSMYGLLVVAGLSATVLGMLGKIVPFLVWMRAYGPRVGRIPVPAATSLGEPRLQTLWLAAHLAAFGLLVAARAHDAFRFLAEAAAWLLLVAVALFVADTACTLDHLRRPRTPQPAASPALTSPTATHAHLHPDSSR